MESEQVGTRWGTKEAVCVISTLTWIPFAADKRFMGIMGLFADNNQEEGQ